jgi:hypothetical protein
MNLTTFGKDELMELAYKRKCLMDIHPGSRNSKDNLFILCFGNHLKAMKEIGL